MMFAVTVCFYADDLDNKEERSYGSVLAHVGKVIENDT